MAAKGQVGELLVSMRAELGQLRLDVRQMEGIFKSSFTNIEAQALSFGKTLASSLGVGFSIGAVTAFANSVIQLGSRLKDLSVQTGISVQTLSGIKSVLEENGTNLEAFSTGIFRLQKELGTIKNDADPTAQAFKELGLNLRELQNADTDKFLDLISTALSKQENPINRNALAFQAMGKQARELVPALLEMAGKLDELKRSGLTPADVQVLDDFADGWVRASNAAKLFAATEIADVIRQLSNDWAALNAGLDFFKDLVGTAATSSLTSFAQGLRNTQLEVLRLYEAFLKIIRVAPLALEFLSFNKLDFNSQMWTDMIKQIQDFRAELESPSSHEAVGEGGTAAFKPPFDQKAADDMKRMIEAIQKANVALQAQIIELNYGKEYAQNYILAQQEMEENSKGISDALKKEQDRRRELTDQLRLELQAIEDIQAISKAWIKDIDALTDAEEKWAAIKMDAESLGLDDLSKTLDQISRKYIKLVADAQAAAAAAGALPDEIESVTRRLLIDKALEQVRARVGFTGEGVDAEEEAKARADKLGADLADSLTSGMRNTLLGIETGQQSLGEGMKNLVRNMMIELEGAIFDKTILEPLKAIAAGFISGLVGALDDAANTQLKDWAKDLGKQVSSWLGSGLSSIFGSGLSFGSAGAAGPELLAGPGFARGGMIPSFASGGLFIGHGGEFVMQKKAVDNIGADTLGMMNKTGKVPGSGGSVVNVEINGDITPRQPNMTPDQVVKVTAGNITNDGMVMSAIEQRLRLRGK